jgi:hypothetical protein
VGGQGSHHSWSCEQEMICQFLTAWTMVYWMAAKQKHGIDP